MDQQLKVKFGLIKTILSIKIFLYKHFALCDKNIDLTNFEKKKISHSKKQATYFDEKYYKKMYFHSFKELFTVNLVSPTFISYSSVTENQ